MTPKASSWYNTRYNGARIIGPGIEVQVRQGFHGIDGVYQTGVGVDAHRQRDVGMPGEQVGFVAGEQWDQVKATATGDLDDWKIISSAAGEYALTPSPGVSFLFLPF